MEGIITRIFDEKGFFFIDNDYKCYFDKVQFAPQVMLRVEYERGTDKNGRPLAKNVKLIKSSSASVMASDNDFFNNYLEELQKGYFEKANFIRKVLVLEDAQKLARLFSKNNAVNKTSQIRKYYDFCRKVASIYKIKKEFSYVQSELPRLIYFVDYALNKKPSLVSNEFKRFVEKNIELAIINEDNFVKGFLYHFEAVIGYSNNN